MSEVRQNLLTLFNRARTNRGLRALTLDSTLNQGADRYADIMAAQNHFSHTRPSGLQWYQWWDQYYPESHDYPNVGIAEIIARGQDTTSEVFGDWMDSPSHREQILDPDNRECGIGLSHSSNGTPYWCVHFITS